jgi:spore maturation protein CgeB
MAISGAKIALCFLSKLNEDTYTTRNFQIPAMRTFMLSEYTPDLASLFEEGKEAEFFRSQDELLDKIRYYLQHDSEREEIAHNGHKRLLADGHDVVSRARQVVAVVEQLRQP